MAREGLTAFEAVNRYFEEAAHLIDLDDEMHSILTSTYREISVQVPVRLDDGELLVVQGYRVQHNGARGPYKGGIRYHPTADARRSPGVGVVDDLEDGSARRPVRRGEGRHRRRSDEHDSRRDPTHDPSVHQRHQPCDRRLPRHPRARRQHQRADDGLDDGRVLVVARVHPRDRDRKAAVRRWPAGPRGSHRARGDLRPRRPTRRSTASTSRACASPSKASATSDRGPPSKR